MSWVADNAPDVDGQNASYMFQTINPTGARNLNDEAGDPVPATLTS